MWRYREDVSRRSGLIRRNDDNYNEFTFKNYNNLQFCNDQRIRLIVKS